MSESKHPLRVFFCYARSDQEIVHKLYTRISKKDGIRAWLDTENLLPGQDWEYEIRKTILGSDVVLVCLSRQFNKQGGYRYNELEMALEKAGLLPTHDEIFIIPVRLEKCAMPKALRRWQRVDLFEADGYKKLLRALKGCN